MRTFLEATQTSLFPAIIILRQEENGPTRMIPIPLKLTTLVRVILALTLSWLLFNLHRLGRRMWRGVGETMAKLTALSETAISWGLAGWYKAVLGGVLGAGRSRSLAWGFLGL